jgi:hypothetical protein
MSRAPTILHGRQPQPPAPQPKSVITILIVAAAAAVVLGSMTAAAFYRSPDIAAMHDAGIPPEAAAAAASAPHGTGVPDASTVFGGRELPTEEPVPTF